MKIYNYLSYGASGQPRRLGIDPEDLESWSVEICPVTCWWAIKQDDICKYGYLLTSCHLPFPYDLPWFCVYMSVSSNIPLPRSMDWMKASPQSHLMSKTLYNNTTTMAQLWMPFSLWIQWYQVSSPLHIHWALYSNCICHASNSL